MKIIRSSKCSLKYLTHKKSSAIQDILTEYGKVVNFFIEQFWHTTLSKGKLLKNVLSCPTTWFTARLRKVAAREAIDMIAASKKRFGEKAKMPIHKGKRMHVSSTIGALYPPKKAHEYDGWLHLASIGNGIILDIPLRFHKHFHKLSSRGRRLESYIITEHYVQFSFEIETGQKKEEGELKGIDTGVNVLAALSDGRQLGAIALDIEKIKHCKYGSKRQKKLYPFHFKNWFSATRKFPRLHDHKRPHISNIGSLMIV